MTTQPRPDMKARRHSVTIALSIICAATLIGTSAWAANSREVTATGSVSTGTLSVSLTPLPDMIFHYDIEMITTSVTVTNTTNSSSPIPGKVSTRFEKSSGDNTLAKASLVWVWPSAGPTACTQDAKPGKGQQIGTWANPIIMADVSLAIGESQTYCVRTMLLDGVEAPTGTRTLTSRITSTLTAGQYFETTKFETGKVETKAIYPTTIPAAAWYRISPINTQNCLDISGGVNAKPGSSLGTYPCHTGNNEIHANQWFKFQLHDEALTTFALIMAKKPANTSISATPNAVIAKNSNAADRTQMWLPQQVAPGTYQFVVLSSGLCLTTTGDSTTSLARCDNLDTQHFTLSAVPAAAPLSVPEPPTETPLETPQSDPHVPEPTKEPHFPTPLPTETTTTENPDQPESGQTLSTLQPHSSPQR